MTAALSSRVPATRRLVAGGLAILLAALAGSFNAGAANATPPALPELWRVPEGAPASGAGAGQVGVPLGLAVDPTSGNLYVGDGPNARIDEFTAWGEFVRAFGWNVDASQPEEKLQVCTAGTGCQQGVPGSGSGQLSGPTGLAVDGEGNVYVVDRANHRVQKFDSAGHFVLMFGGEVDKATHGNVCTAASGHACGIGVTGTANGQFAEWEGLFSGVQRIAVGPGENIYVSDEDRIQVFDAEGAYQSQLSLPKEGEVAGGSKEGKGQAGSIALDAAGDVYFDFWRDYDRSGHEDTSPYIFKHTASGWSLFAKTEFPRSLATDAAGHLYAVDNPIAPVTAGKGPPRVIEFDSSGAPLLPTELEEQETTEANPDETGIFKYFAELPKSEIQGLAASDACNLESADVFVAHLFPDSFTNQVEAFGPQPDPATCPPPRNPPAIADQYATSVGAGGATLRAKVNSRFWPTTTYRVEYGTEPCSLGGCELTSPRALGSKTNSAVLTDGVFVSGLLPGTTYHYRFVASTCFESKPGGNECETGQRAVVKGLGGTPSSDGAEGTFATPEPTLPPKEDCPNQALRTGLSSLLPDCRAYEMVSPVEKGGGDIVTLVNVSSYPARLDQSASSGERLTYSSYRPFGGARAANTSSQYVATREPGVGWSNEPISPPIGRSLVPSGANVEREYALFSPDLCQSWLRDVYQAEPVLDPAALPGYPDLYRRQNCGADAGGYEALTGLAPPHRTAAEFDLLEPQGASADGSVAVYVADDNLTPEAPAINAAGAAKLPQLYARAADGTTRYVCFLPSGSPAPGECAAGIGKADARSGQLTGAVSADGSRVFFTTGDNLYLRTNPTAEQSPVSGGHCSDEQLACTTLVAAEGKFWAASPDGTEVLFIAKTGALKEYDVEEGTVATVAGSGVLGVLGQSTDLSRVYFVSTAKLAAGAVANQDNLYFHEVGEATRFLGAVVERDVNPTSQGSPVLVTPEPIKRATRVSPDGLTAAFAARAPLTGYDNKDAQTAEADTEVFVYRAEANGGEGQLSCVSCDPSGARPTGATLKAKPWEGVRVAAWIPTWESSLFASNALSEDGTRLFFNSAVALVPRDTNGRQDVYEWRLGESRSACEAQGAERYVPSAGGCISLISSGESVLDSEFIDAGSVGRDVFFTTSASLLPQDPGLIDIYDARESGGLPEPAKPPAGCEGEACQSPPAAPVDPTVSSASFEGTGNVEETKPHGCRKGRVRRHGRCVPEKHSKKHASKHRRHPKRASR